MQNVQLTGNYWQEAIEKKKQVEETNLQNFSIDNFSNALDHLSDGFLLVDKNLIFLYTNAQAVKVLKRNADDLVGKNLLDVFPEIKDTPFIKAIESAQKTQVTVILEGNNSPWGKQYKNCIYPSNVGICILISETPDHKLAKDSIVDEIRRLVEAQRIANLGCWEFDSSTHKLYFSDEMLGILGISPASFTHSYLSFLKLIHPDDREAVKKFLVSLQKTGYTDECNFRILSPDNSIRYIQIRGEAIHSETGKPVRITGTIYDITKSKQIEEQLKETQEVFFRTFKFNPAAMLITTIPEGICMEVNESFTNMLEFSPEEIIGRTTLDLEIYTNPNHRLQLYQVLSEKGEVNNVELVFRTKSGKLITGLVSLQPLHFRGKDYALIMAVNITKRRQAEIALEENERLLNRVLENSPDIIYAFDISSNRFMFINRRDLFGFSIEELQNHETILGRIHPEDRHVVIDAWNESTQTGSSHQIEYRFKKKDGSWIWIQQRATLFSQHGDGTPKQLLISITDISLRKQAEIELQESEDRFRLLIENASDLVYQVALDKDLSVKKLIFLSPQFSKIFGLKNVEEMNLDPEALYDSVLKLIHPDDLPQLLGSVKTLLINKSSVDRVYRAWNAVKNDYIWISDRITPRMDSKGNLTGYQGISRDITEQKLAEKALHESEKRYQMISSIASDYMYESRFGKDGRSTLIWTAGAFESITGYTMEEYNARGGWRTILHPDDQVIDDRDQEKLRSNQPVTSEIRTFKKDGSLVWLSVYARPVIDEQTGEYIGVYGAAKDITERKMVEEEIKKQLTYQKAVNRISTILRGAQTLDEILPHLLKETLSMVETETGAIWLYDKHTKNFEHAVANGWFTELKKPNMTAGEGIAGTVYKTGEVHISPDFRHDPLLYKRTINEVPEGWGGICVPIRAEMETIGVLFVAKQIPHHWGEEDVRLLTTVSEIAGNTIHRARLHDQTQRQLKHLSALHDIDHAISSTLDLHLLLDTLLSHITLQLHVDAADVLQFDPQTQNLEFITGLGFNSPLSQKFRTRMGEGHAGQAALNRKIIGVSDNSQSADSKCTRILEIPEEGFVAHYAVPLIVKNEVKGVLEVFHRDVLTPEKEWFVFLDTLAGQVAIAMDNATMFESLQQSNLDLAVAYNATIEGWSKALDMRDKETENHTRRVTELTLRLARRMGINEEKIVHIWRGALLHDIGKLGVPDNILLKAGSLTEDEQAIMKRHPQLAYDMLYPIEYLRPALDIPYCHHEKWDGSGYPRGLKGSEIPLSARMFALADVFDALTTDRPYRKAWTYERAIKYICDQSGKHFDPVLANVFTYLLRTGELGTSL